MFETMNDIPTAVIKGVSRGACRSGRYATRSIVALTTANSGMVIASVSTIPPTTARLLESPVSPRTERSTVLATSPDSEKTSPWAKLISWRIP
ncbi:MAG TPA: hypothetical protein VFM67_03835 [Gaiella sp.]|nr:hypothetical protein [Gaiella sp.]